MKKYLVAAAFILCAPETVLAQAEIFYVVLDHTTNQCTVMTNEPTTQKTRYKTLGKYATQDEAKAALELHDRKCLPKIMSESALKWTTYCRTWCSGSARLSSC